MSLETIFPVFPRPRKVEIMVKLPFSKSQSGNIQRQSDERGRGCNAVSQVSPVVIFGGGARGDFFLSTSLHFIN